MDEYVAPAGNAIPRNPGVALVWISDRNGGPGRPKPFKVSANAFANTHEGVLFHVGDPVETLWFAEGRAATKAEIAASVESGFPALYEIATKEGPDAVAELGRLAEQFWRMLEVDNGKVQSYGR